MRFRKYHGLGNDFVVVDVRSEALTPSPEDPAAARALCDRHFGVGGDGVLAILPPRSEGADARMRVLNADGSEAEMCGNGLRCVVKYLHDYDESMRRDTLTIDTGAGPLVCHTHGKGGVTETVTVNMGRPRLARRDVPMAGPANERALEVALEAGGRSMLITGVSMGNPHGVVFVDETGASLRALAESVGPSVETHALFPAKANIEFCRLVSSTEIEMVVWERGVGITLACGTGACAAVTAACLTGRCNPGEEVTVHLLGGDLAITVAEDYSAAFMRGSATEVFTADIDLADMLASGVTH